MFTDDLRKIDATLKHVWLLQSEIDIFFLWLENGALTIGQLAQLSKMNRITVHEIVYRMIQKWLFLETYSWKKRLVYPNQVDALERLVEHKKFEVQQLEKEAKKATSVLRSLQVQSENFPKTRFYKGQEGIYRMLAEIKQDASDIAIMSDRQHFYELIDNNFLEQSLDLRNKKNVNVRLLFPSWFEYFTYTQGTYQQRLEIKNLPEERLLKGGLTIRNNKVAFHCYEGKFISTTILENRRIAGIQQYLFDQLWLQAKSY